jgi:CO/xanthine dehydrogenase FAD-binding subunit
LDETLRLLAEPQARVLAGGTDLFPAAGDRPLQGAVIDISDVAGLRGIVETDEHFRIGGATTWRELARAPLPQAFAALGAAAREIGAVQIQNRATLAGNLCNASPAADGVPPLLVLDAEVELVSLRGVRRLPLGDFITGNRRTLKEPDELLTAILVPRAAARGRSTFLKLGARRYLVISIVMAAVLLEADADAKIARARIAVGACSAVARRLRGAEAALLDRPLAPGLASALEREHCAELAPIDDLRAPAAYRWEAAHALVGRALEACARGEAGGVI